MNFTFDPGAVISRALDIYRENFVVLVVAAAVLFAVQLALAIVLGGSFGVFVGVIAVLLGTIYQGMVVELVRDVQDGRLDSSVGQLFGSIGPVVFTLVVVAFLSGVAEAIGFALLVVPFLFLITIWSVTAPAVVIERVGVLGAFRRSRELVRGHGWSVFAVVLVVVVGLAIVSALASVVTAGLGDVASAIVTWVITSLTQPLSGLAAAVLYFTLRSLAGEPPVGSGAAGEGQPLP
jgi:ABC-type multidrug transport system fused ATPase/permease subunit